MARDPFALNPQPSIPPWVWAVVGVFGVLFIGLGVTVFVVVTHRAVPAAMAATTPAPAPAVAAPPAQPQPAAAANPAPAPGADKAATADQSEAAAPAHEGKRHVARHHRGGGAPAVASAAAPASKPAPAKKKSDYSQKEIDNLLGIGN